MFRLDIIKLNSQKINALAAKFNADKVYVFGSCARKEENPDSDINFLVGFNADASSDDQANFQAALQKMFFYKVTVISMRDLKPSTKDKILLEAVVI